MEGRYEDLSNFLSIQVDQGGTAPPIRVVVRGEEDEDFEEPDWVNTFVYRDWLMVDRRDGLYNDENAAL